MSSILNIFSTNADEFNKIILVPVVVAIVAVVLIFKLSFHKQDVTKTSQNSKKQKTVHSKKEDKLASSDKRERLANESKKATKSSPLKSLATKAVDTTAELNKKHMLESEKPINNHTTKKQKANTTISNQNPKIHHAKINNKDSSKKAVVKNVHNNVAEEQGEWQTVTTKKQKPTKNENVKEVSVLSNNIEKLQKISSKNKTTKTPKITKNKEDATSAPINLYAAANINEELTPQEIISTKSTSRQNIRCVDDTHKTTFAAVQQNHANVDAPFISSAAEVVNKDVSIFNTPIPQVLFNTARDNVAFNDLGDGDWTDTKPQKKNKKRALRE